MMMKVIIRFGKKLTLFCLLMFLFLSCWFLLLLLLLLFFCYCCIYSASLNVFLDFRSEIHALVLKVVLKARMADTKAQRTAMLRSFGLKEIV
jgi:hypothetical protein